MAVVRPRTKSSNDQEVTLKIILLGDSSVGKSCFLMRYYEDVFAPDSTQTTIGMDFKIKKETIDGRIVKIWIWDTAGQEKFRAITKAYYKGAHAIFLLYDVTNRESFLNLCKWMKIIEQEASTRVPKILIGNKSDLLTSLNTKTFPSSETFISMAAIDNSSLFDVSLSTSSLSTVSLDSLDSLDSIPKDSFSSRESFSSTHKQEEVKCPTLTSVSLEEGKLFAFDNEFKFFFLTSTLTGENVKKAFQKGCTEALVYVLSQNVVASSSPLPSPRVFNRLFRGTPPVSPLSPRRSQNTRPEKEETPENHIVLSPPPSGRRRKLFVSTTTATSNVTSQDPVLFLPQKPVATSPSTPRTPTPTTPTPGTPTSPRSSHSLDKSHSSSKDLTKLQSNVIRLTEFSSSTSNVAPECCSV